MTGDETERMLSGPAPRREAGEGGAVLWRAPAKLNLSLRVLGRRADGFHEIDSVVAKITLYDDLYVAPRSDGRVSLECVGADCGPAEENLVVRAAGLVSGGGGGRGADLRLVKRIPLGAGLGGGSSDAAAALLALNELWEAGADAEQLRRWAGELGSDVAMFLGGPASRMRGRGLRLEPLTIARFHALVVTPAIHCPTRQVYAAHDAAAAEAPAGGRWDRMVESGVIEGPPSSWRAELVNDLAAAAVRVRPALAEVIERFEAAAGAAVHVTGSGSAVFCLFDEAADARSAAASVPQELRTRSRVVALNPW